MKIRVKLIFILFFLLMQAKAQYPALVQLNGKLTNIPSAKKIILYYVNAEGKSVADSADIEDGRYTFVAQILEPHDAILKIIRQYPVGEKPAVNPLYSPENIAKVFINAGTISINSTDSFSNIEVSGATWQKDFKYLEEVGDKLKATSFEQQEEWYKYKEKGDAKAMNNIIEKGNKNIAIIVRDVYYSYAKAHPASPLSIWALRICVNGGKAVSHDEVIQLFNALSPAIKSLPVAKNFEHYMNFTAALEIGAPAPQFSLQNTDGKLVPLSSFKGKYVLLDFWASWCAPCRAETPYIQAALAQYGKNNFTVLSITSPRESGREAWLNAIKADKMIWTNVWDKEGTVSKMYNVDAIPSNFLINDKGIIVGKNLRSEELGRKLKEVMGE